MHILVSVVIIVSVIAYFFYASYSIRACIYMRVFCLQEKPKRKIIAITFLMTGPIRYRPPKVLKVLREKHIPACFFLHRKQDKKAMKNCSGKSSKKDIVSGIIPSPIPAIFLSIPSNGCAMI